MNTIAKVKVGDTVSFETKHPTDNIEHTGKVVAISSYDVAKGYFDIASYHHEVKKAVPSLESMEGYSYLLLQTDGQIIPFAFEWIESSTLKINYTQRKLRLVLYDVPEAEDSAVLDLLRSKGYSVSIVQ